MSPRVCRRASPLPFYQRERPLPLTRPVAVGPLLRTLLSQVPQVAHLKVLWGIDYRPLTK
eukprot:gene10710-biopygen8376